MEYTRNSKNRKIKTSILAFFSRLNFGTYRLGLPGKMILVCLIFLFASLFFPWLTLMELWETQAKYFGAFSIYLGWIGYGIIFSIFLITFFLLSHEKKEHIRGYIPFRLSDAQAIVFIGTILMTATLCFMIASLAYSRLSTHTVGPTLGMKIALSANFLLFIASYYFSQAEKTRASTLSYLEKREHTHLDEYRDILDSQGSREKKMKEKNMSLPI